MAKKKLNQLDPAALTLNRLLGHGHPSTGKMNRATFADLVALFTAQTPVKTYADQTALLANTDLVIGYIAYVADSGTFYLYNGPEPDDIGNYTTMGGGDEHFQGVYLSSAALTSAVPSAEPGDYAYVDEGPDYPVELWIWDENDTEWVSSGSSAIVPDASTTQKGIVELATPAEVITGTDTVRAVTPEGNHLKNRNESAETADRALAQTDDQKVLFANKATTLTFDLPSLAENTWIIIVQANAGAVAFTTSGGVTFENAVTPAISGGAIGSGLALWYRTSTSVIAMVGDITNLLTSLSVNGTLAVKAGSSSGILAKVGGVLFTNTTTTGNSGTGEDLIFQYTVPAATLATNKDSLRGFVAGSYAANGNNKNIRVKFGTSVTMFTTGAIATNAGSWRVDFYIIRTGATTQKCVAAYTSSNTTLDETCTYATATETLANAIPIEVTGEATNTNDILGEMFRVEFLPHE